MADGWREGRRFNRSVTFRFGDCDAEGRASLYSIMKLFTEMAGDDYELRGLGHGRLLESGQAFLLSKMSLRVHRLPAYGEELTASTWERRVKGVFFFRDHELLDGEGRAVVSASGSWFLVEPATREVLRPDALIGPLPEATEMAADCAACPKLRPRPGTELRDLGERPVYYSDLDANGHVNNAVYSRVAVDFLPREHRERKLRDYFIIFKKETRPGETLKILGSETEDGFYLQAVTGDTVHFQCGFVFE